MASHHDVAEKAAERVMQVIERNGRIIKNDIVEAIEGVLALQHASVLGGVGGYGPQYGVPVFISPSTAIVAPSRGLIWPCGND